MKIELTCERCNNTFQRAEKEYKRNLERKQRICCSRSCTAYLRNASMSKEYWKQSYEKQKKTFDIKSVSGLGNPKDELSPFRFFFTKCKSRKKHYDLEFDLSLEDLKQLWESQNGTCPYSKLKMILPESTNHYQTVHSLKKASLDRIDSDKGYVRGNVEFVCLAVNLAKNNFTKKEATSFFNEVASIENGGREQS